MLSSPYASVVICFIWFKLVFLSIRRTTGFTMRWIAVTNPGLEAETRMNVRIGASRTTDLNMTTLAVDFGSVRQSATVAVLMTTSTDHIIANDSNTCIHS